MFRAFAVALILWSSAAWAQAPRFESKTPDEAALVAADATQRAAVATGDSDAIAAIAHPNFRVNAPSNRVLTKEVVLSMVRSGEIKTETFERIPESVTITGDVGVVMGREILQASAGSESARMYGMGTLQRRYTNVFLRVGGKWLHLARHANVIAAEK